jgi:hypothetical protein
MTPFKEQLQISEDSLNEVTESDLDDLLGEEETHLDFLKEELVHPTFVGHDPRS